MLVAILTTVAVGALILLTLLYGMKGQPNQEPAIGTNRPSPDGLGLTGAGADEPPYLPQAVIGDAEAYRRKAMDHFARSGRKDRSARSWMEEPGAFARYGLVDDDRSRREPALPDKGTAPQHHQQRKQRVRRSKS